MICPIVNQEDWIVQHVLKGVWQLFVDKKVSLLLPCNKAKVRARCVRSLGCVALRCAYQGVQER